MDIAELWLLGRTYHIDEIVLPDVLYDYQGTLDESWLAVEWIKRHSYNWQYAPNLMFVPQGNNPGEWAFCLYNFIANLKHRPFWRPMHESKLIIGVAKHTSSFPGGRYSLIENFLVPLVKDFYDLRVHLLGWEDNEPWRVKEIARQFPFVRSIDSAQPYKYGKAGIPLIQDQPNPVLKRQKNFFELHFNPLEAQLAEMNMELFRNEAKGIVTYDPTK